MSTPNELPSITSSAAWHSTYTYKVRSTTTTHVVYDLWQVAQNNWFTSTSGGSGFPSDGFQIKVGISSSASDYNTWTDKGSVHPYVVTETSNGTVQLLENNGTLDYEFTKPTTASWISSGSGTETEGSTSPSGSTYINSQGQIVFVITASSPSSDGNISYKIYRRPIGSAFEQAYVVPHTSGSSDTEWTIGLNYSLYDRWELRVESSTALVQSATLAVYTTVKKVFRNFW